MSLKHFLKDRVEQQTSVRFSALDLHVGYAETDKLHPEQNTAHKIAVLTVYSDGSDKAAPSALMAVGYHVGAAYSFVGVFQFHDASVCHAGDLLARMYALLFEMGDDYFEPTVPLETPVVESVGTDALEALVYEKLNAVYTAANPTLPPLSPEQHEDSDIMDVFTGAELREALTGLSAWLKTREVGWTPGDLMEIVFEHDTLGNFVADLALQVAEEG